MIWFCTCLQLYWYCSVQLKKEGRYVFIYLWVDRLTYCKYSKQKKKKEEEEDTL